MIEGCIFDLDGVIVDTAKYHFLAWQRLAADLGFDFTQDDNEALKGVSRMTSLDILLEKGGMKSDFTTAEKEQMATIKNEWYVEYINRMSSDEILPGVVEFLSELRARDIKTALGSASKNAGLILSKTGITALFDAVVDGNMVSQAKPDPQVFLLGAKMIGIPPSRCVVFEDAEAGIEAAANAGMRSVAVGQSALLDKATARIAGFEGLNLAELKQMID